MSGPEYFAIGLMSGTSLDGLDICFVRFQKNERWIFEILAAETVPYSLEWDNRLRKCMTLSTPELFELNADYGFYLGAQVQKFIEKKQITHLDLIASHGHTVLHQPQRRFTVQIGDGRAIKQITGVPVAYDFRSQDVLLGGNGAPLVPIGDQMLFNDYEACLNLGGFSNISFENGGRRVAFDISPVNIVLNDISAEFGQKYDDGGQLAANGIFSQELFSKLNALEFYHQPFPKSLGAEWVNEVVTPVLAPYSKEEKITTFTHHAAYQIAKSFREFNLPNVLVSGGGAYNCELLRLITDESGANIIVPDAAIVNYKEALIFAFMGVLRLRNENNVLSSATGSRYDHCTGHLV